MIAVFLGAVRIREKHLLEYDTYFDLRVRQHDVKRRAVASVWDPVLSEGNKITIKEKFWSKLY